LFDLVFKANRRNVRLMQVYLQKPEATTSRSTGSVMIFLLVLLGVLVMSVWLIFKVLGFVIGLF